MGSKCRTLLRWSRRQVCVGTGLGQGWGTRGGGWVLPRIQGYSRPDPPTPKLRPGLPVRVPPSYGCLHLWNPTEIEPRSRPRQLLHRGLHVSSVVPLPTRRNGRDGSCTSGPSKNVGSPPQDLLSRLWAGRPGPFVRSLVESDRDLGGWV